MLKKMLFTIAIVTVAFTAEAQFRKIPVEVTDAFKAKYANATKVEWMDKMTSFEVGFTSDGKERKANYNSKGEWSKTETKESLEGLPPEVQEGFKKSKYADQKVTDVTQIEEKEKGVRYKLAVKKSGLSKKNLVFDPTGKLLSDNGTL